MTGHYIELTAGHRTIVDDEDYEELSKYKWHADWSPSGYYAKRNMRRDGRATRTGMHRQILGIIDNPDLEGDHINGDTLDNRRSNLRVVTHKQNMENRRGAQSNSKTGIRGVSLDTRYGTYRACIGHNQRQIHLGCFATLQEATEAVQAGRAKYFTALEDGK